MNAVCDIPEAKGLVTAAEFDPFLDRLFKFSEDGPRTGPEVEGVFEGFETALSDAEETVAVAVRAAEALKQAKAEFATKAGSAERSGASSGWRWLCRSRAVRSRSGQAPNSA